MDKIVLGKEIFAALSLSLEVNWVKRLVMREAFHIVWNCYETILVSTLRLFPVIEARLFILELYETAFLRANVSEFLIRHSIELLTSIE